MKNNLFQKKRKRSEGEKEKFVHFAFIKCLLRKYEWNQLLRQVLDQSTVNFNSSFHA